MPIGTITDLQRKAARIAGLAYILSFATVVSAEFAIFQRLTLSGDAAGTGRNILAHETLFRVGIVGFLLYSVGTIVLLTALYVILKPVDQMLALLAAFGRLGHAFTWLLVPLNQFTVLRVLQNADYTRAFGPDQLPQLARLYLSGYDQYYVGLLFLSLGATLGAYLWFKSGYIPRALAVFGVVASVWCVACTLTLYIFPEFPKVVNLWWFDFPMALFELVLSFLLLFRGLGRSGTSEPAYAHAGQA